MKIILLFITLCFAVNKISAANIIADSIPPGKPWKISKQQFLDQYGKDDKSKAIISFYFGKYTGPRKGLYVFIPLTVIVTSVALAAVPGAGFPILPAITVGIDVITISLLDIVGNYSRKELLKSLNKYFSGKGISREMKRWIRYENKMKQ